MSDWWWWELISIRYTGREFKGRLAVPVLIELYMPVQEAQRLTDQFRKKGRIVRSHLVLPVRACFFLFSSGSLSLAFLFQQEPPQAAICVVRRSAPTS